MNHRLRIGGAWVVGAVLLLALAGCNNDDISSLPEAQGATGLYGTWSECLLGSPDTRDTVTFDPSGSASETLTTYGSTDGSCSTTPSPSGPFNFTFITGNKVTVTLGGVPVGGQELNISAGGGYTYNIFYIDLASFPHRLYVGDLSAPNDGSTPALRPTVLRTDLVLKRQ